ERQRAGGDLGVAACAIAAHAKGGVRHMSAYLTAARARARPWPTRAGLSALILIMSGWPVSAYRPFEGTDAAVAERCRLRGGLQQGADKTLVAPDWVLNYGFADGWEAIVQGQGRFPLGASDESASLAGAGAFLKHVLREGVLQEKTGPSVATEFGVLLPGIN